MTEAEPQAPTLRQRLTPERLSELSDDRLGTFANVNALVLLLHGLLPGGLLLLGRALLGDVVSVEHAMVVWWLMPATFAILLEEPWNKATVGLSGLVLLALAIGCAVMEPDLAWVAWTGPVVFATVLLGLWNPKRLSLCAILFLVHAASWLVVPPPYLLAGPVLYALALLGVRQAARKLVKLRAGASQAQSASGGPQDASAPPEAAG